MTEFHDWSGLPYWSVIVATSLATRFCLLPLLSMSMRSASVNVAIWRTASAIAPSRGVSRWALFQAARQRAGAPSLLWPFANAIAVISVLGQLSRVVRKMAVVGWPGFHLEGPQVLEGKLQSLVVSRCAVVVNFNPVWYVWTNRAGSCHEAGMC